MTTEVSRADLTAAPYQFYFGGCPRCGKVAEFMDVDRQHFGTCRTCRTYWTAGANIFSRWRYMTQDQFDQNAAWLSTCEEVEPMRPTQEELDAYDAAHPKSESERLEEIPW
jgi:hypothetical protein